VVWRKGRNEAAWERGREGARRRRREERRSGVAAWRREKREEEVKSQRQQKREKREREARGNSQPCRKGIVAMEAAADCEAKPGGRGEGREGGKVRMTLNEDNAIASQKTPWSQLFPSSLPLFIPILPSFPLSTNIS